MSDVPVTVKWSLTDTNGNPYAATTVLYTANFSGSNTPLNLQTGATLQPGEMGEINIQDNGVRTINVGKLSWYADNCIDEALMVTLRSQSTESSRMASNLILLNDGKPF